MQLPEHAPLTREQRDLLEALFTSLEHSQKSWLAGYLSGLTQGDSVSSGAASSVSKPEVHVLFATESGNCEALADQAAKRLRGQGFTPVVRNVAACKISDVAAMHTVLVITSTWGDGEPPDAAVDFHAALMADGATRLDNVRFSVCALGDTSYEKFCQTGRDFDTRLADLGATRLVERQECDVDYDAAFQQWMDRVLAVLVAELPATTAVALAPSASVGAAGYGKSNPFPATLREKILLNGRGSAKETLHFEFSLEGSGLSYEPGDSLAVRPRNAPDVVEDLLRTTGLDGGAAVSVAGLPAAPLGDVLTNDLDITGLTRQVIEKYSAGWDHSGLAEMLADKQRLADYLHGRQIVDLVADYPHPDMSPALLVGMLRKLPPRLYSIASSLKAHPNEVHLTVAVVRYHAHGRDRKGVASTFLADLVDIGSTVPVFVSTNKHFKLPTDSSTPIIMVGPGTGIAPFRAFVEERAAMGATGRNWLFFGDQHYSYDFLYQLEWQEHLKNGTLNRLDLAFSRDQPQKIYVQDRMRQAGRDLWDWMEQGAVFYVCGDASRMARDVHEALISICETHGGFNREQAEARVADWQKQKRYLRDVY